MHTAPAVRVVVTRFGVWRGALGVVLALGGLVIGAWAVSHVLAQGWPAAAPVVALGSAAALLCAALAASLARIAPFALFWDGRCWFLSDAVAPSADAVAGELQATVDLGGWLLLRFTPERGPARWLPVQRQGLAPAWHALRCAVYSPRPSIADSAAADPE